MADGADVAPQRKQQCYAEGASSIFNVNGISKTIPAFLIVKQFFAGKTRSFLFGAFFVAAAARAVSFAVDTNLYPEYTVVFRA